MSHIRAHTSAAVRRQSRYDEMNSIFAPALDVEAGPDAGHLTQPGVQPLAPALHRRAQASQRFIVGNEFTCSIYAQFFLTAQFILCTACIRPFYLQACTCISQLLQPMKSRHAGVVILLFVAGIVPFASLLFLLVALFLFASCIQYHVLARNDVQHIRPRANATLPAWGNAERMQRAAVLSMLGTFGLGNPSLGNVLAGHSTGGAFHNLRLSMMNRDFTDAGKCLM